ncbi:MAG: MBL fold metallo-hydrolase [Proteobacteria bacterium]|nr:MBL fold metallo-hydrolase [Pseudomonadota bacterium]
MKKAIFLLLIPAIISFKSHAHDAHNQQAMATYLGNEAIMIENADSKILFDPFFHNNYNLYQLVPEEMRQALFNNQAPYDNIDVIFISHAHGDHFAADDVLRYLTSYPKIKLVAPKQAIDKLMALENSQAVKKQTIAIELKRGDKPKTIKLDKLLIEAVRIPHAGWPGRADVSNLVFRVTLDKNVTVMHMGDDDPDDEHFKPYKDYWQKNLTNTAFPPYWFFTSEDGPIILDERINAEKSIGIHVPVKVPFELEVTDEPYFSKPGEQEIIGHKH